MINAVLVRSSRVKDSSTDTVESFANITLCHINPCSSNRRSTVIKRTLKYQTQNCKSERVLEATRELKQPNRRRRRERVYFVVGPVVAWSCLCLVKLCGTHLTSAFSVSGIHCYNYAIMSLYSLMSDCTPPPSLCRNASIRFFFFPSLCLSPCALCF